ncbi:MAG TPA: hypothetical protein VMC10_23355 [Stellaceae bacterium]|nr:hypothetical protein [Stellaceae bacterium]
MIDTGQSKLGLIQKAVLLRGQRLGHAASWTEVRALLGICGWQVKPQVLSLGVESRGCFIVDETAVERLP